MVGNFFQHWKILSKGFQIGNDGVKIHVSKEDFHLCLDKVMKNKLDYVLVAGMITLESEI